MSNKDFGITPSAKSLGELIEIYGKGGGLEIPPYQRGYEWNDKNVQRFIDTLFKEYEKSLEGENDVTIFLGPIQISVEGKEDKRTYSIIDGRQRITTLSLLENYLNRRGFPSKTTSDKPIISLLRFNREDESALPNRLENLAEAVLSPYALLNENNPSVLRLKQKAKKEANSEEGDGRDLYKRNSRYIATILKNKNNLEGFLDFLKESVFFVVIEVVATNLTSIIKIFDSMNSTGQPLSDQAMFKLRFYAHVRSYDSISAPEEIMSHINSTYALVDSYNESHSEKIYMDDVLWGFRLYCIANKEKLILSQEGIDQVKGDSFLMNTLSFFEFLFDREGARITLEEFEGYTKSHIEFYQKAYSDLSWDKNSGKSFLQYGLLDYFAYTRYSQFWVLPVVRYAITKGSIEDALSPFLDVFEAAIVWSTCYERTNKAFRTSFLYELVRTIDKDSFKKECLEKIRFAFKDRGFWSKIEKDVYDHYRITYLLLGLLGVEDEFNKGRSFGDSLKSYFGLSWKDRPQIEHIYAKEKFKDSSKETKSLLNGLGNLVLLESSINQGKGKDAKPSDKFSSDIFFKNSKLQSVHNLIDLYNQKKERNLNDPESWRIEIANVRFMEAKSRLLALMDLLEESPLE